MPSTYSTRARFTLQNTGENFNTWGNLLNTQDMQLIDDAIAGLYAFTLSGPVTLSANQGAADQSRMAALNITGGSGGTVTIPAVSKLYVVKNQAVGNAVFQPQGSSNSAIVYAGETIQIGTDGANVWRVHAANFDGQTLSNLGSPANPNDAATKTYVDNAVAGVVVGPFPPQPGQQGKFIGTDGAVPTWSTSSALTWQLGGLKLGGQTNAFPYLKQVGATLASRLADDSGDALITGASPPAGDSSQNLATTAWVNARGWAYGGPYQISGSSSLTAAAAGSLQVINATGITTTLPLLSTMKPGQVIHFLANGSTSIVAPGGSDNLFMNNATYNMGITLGVGDWLEVTVNSAASNWTVTAGTPGLFNTYALQNTNFNTPAQFANTGNLATTQFVQRALGNRQTIASTSGGQTLTPAQAGQYVVLTGPGTVFLPLSSAVPGGSCITLKNNNSTAQTIGRQGSDTFILGNVGSLTQFTLESGGFVDCYSVGGGWYVDGSSSLGNTGWFTHVFGTNGYQYMPGGTLMQWMVNTSSATAGATIVANWNIAFPNYWGALWLTGWASGPSPMANCHGYNISQSQYQFVCILASTQVSALSIGH